MAIYDAFRSTRNVSRIKTQATHPTGLGTRVTRMAINYHLQDQFLDKFFMSQFGPDFYLTGGTALARFYFHHRESIDLDLFTQNKNTDFAVLNLFVEKIGLAIGLKTVKQVVTNAFLQYIFEDISGEGLKVDIVKDIPVHFGEFKQEGMIRVDSLENIGTNKVLAIFGRTDHKDFIDLYYILHQTQLTFDYLVSLAKQKDVGLTEFYLANSIDQLQTATQMPALLRPLDVDVYKAFYKQISEKMLSKLKPEDT